MEKYTWGDFTIVVITLLIIYYAVIYFVYYFPYSKFMKGEKGSIKPNEDTSTELQSRDTDIALESNPFINNFDIPTGENFEEESNINNVNNSNNFDTFVRNDDKEVLNEAFKSLPVVVQDEENNQEEVTGVSEKDIDISGVDTSADLSEILPEIEIDNIEMVVSEEVSEIEDRSALEQNLEHEQEDVSIYLSETQIELPFDFTTNLDPPDEVSEDDIIDDEINKSENDKSKGDDQLLFDFNN